MNTCTPGCWTTKNIKITRNRKENNMSSSQDATKADSSYSHFVLGHWQTLPRTYTCSPVLWRRLFAFLGTNPSCARRKSLETALQETQAVYVQYTLYTTRTIQRYMYTVCIQNIYTVDYLPLSEAVKCSRYQGFYAQSHIRVLRISTNFSFT
jgi:hypothetical protein